MSDKSVEVMEKARNQAGSAHAGQGNVAYNSSARVAGMVEARSAIDKAMMRERIRKLARKQKGR